MKSHVLPRPIRRALLVLWVVACVVFPGSDHALAEQSSSDAAELLALLSLRDTASYEVVAPRVSRPNRSLPHTVGLGARCLLGLG